MDENKPYGQICYEAYSAKNRLSRSQVIPWAELPTRLKAAWTGGAESVVEAFCFENGLERFL